MPRFSNDNSREEWRLSTLVTSSAKLRRAVLPRFNRIKCAMVGPWGLEPQTSTRQSRVMMYSKQIQGCRGSHHAVLRSIWIARAERRRSLAFDHYLDPKSRFRTFSIAKARMPWCSVI